MRILCVYVLVPLLAVFIAYGSIMLNKNEDIGIFILLLAGGLSLLVGTFYLKFRSTMGELKDEIKHAIKRADLGPNSGRRASQARR